MYVLCTYNYCRGINHKVYIKPTQKHLFWGLTAFQWSRWTDIKLVCLSSAGEAQYHVGLTGAVERETGAKLD